jgi:hypothetical protein
MKAAAISRAFGTAITAVETTTTTGIAAGTATTASMIADEDEGTVTTKTEARPYSV